jgi:hypothetical protein
MDMHSFIMESDLLKNLLANEFVKQRNSDKHKSHID